jgi:hypothetical protein
MRFWFVLRPFFLFTAAFFLSGCGEEHKAPATPPAQDGYLGALARGQQVAVKGIDIASLNHTLQLYNAQEGHYPATLDELVTQKYIAKIPEPPAGMTLSYDPAQGKVTITPQ